jgi:hypothetical protein
LLNNTVQRPTALAQSFKSLPIAIHFRNILDCSRRLRVRTWNEEKFAVQRV